MNAYSRRTRHVLAAGLLAALLWPGAAATRPAARPAVTVPAAGVLLVAKRDMLSPSFAQSVVLLIKHDARGSLGVILNRRTRLTLQDVLPNLDTTQAARHTLRLGGPVAPQSLLLVMRKEAVAEGVERVTGDITTSTHLDVLRALIMRKKSPDDLRAYIGYAGWAGGQLEGELARGAWHLVPATEEHVFGEDEELWEQLIDQLDPPGIRVRAPSQPVVALPRSD
jgi:putative transcriptional regulator